MSRMGIEVLVELAVRGPILVHGSEIGPWGVDAVALRDPAGRLVIPGDAVQGKVREAYDEIQGDPLDGNRSRRQDMKTLREHEAAEEKTAEAAREYESFKSENLDADIRRYPLFFSEFVSAEPWPPAGFQAIAQTAIDRKTGSAKQGSLRLFDCPVPAGEVAHFTGAVRFFSSDQVTADAAIERLLVALNWVLSFGSQRSVGFGRHCGGQRQPAARIAEKQVTRFDKLAGVQITQDAAPKVLVDFTFEDPLCLPAGVVNGNIYETRDEIPGEALRGALAEVLRQIDGLAANCRDLSEASSGHPFKKLCDAFDRVRITTARPTKAQDSLPVRVIPQSLAVARGKMFDFALEEDVAAPIFKGQAAAFSHDWKQKDRRAAREYFHTVLPRQELRVRTAIDERGKRRAKTHNLFAYRTLRPEGICWRATISVDDRPPNGVPAQQILSQLLAILQSGWLSVGKTRSRGTGRLVAVGKAPAPVQPMTIRGRADQVFVITLRGPALMIDPREYADADGCMNCLGRIDQLYAKYWDEISGGCLEEIAERRFKIDSLVGGYQARKYRYDPDLESGTDMSGITDLKKRIEMQRQFPYNPTRIVDPGSVFVLKLAAGKKVADAQGVIALWQAHGLPLPSWAKRAYGDTHHTNIFLPQNGFGEIDVNLPEHNASFLSPLTTVEE